MERSPARGSPATSPPSHTLTHSHRSSLSLPPSLSPSLSLSLASSLFLAHTVRLHRPCELRLRSVAVSGAALRRRTRREVEPARHRWFFTPAPREKPEQVRPPPQRRTPPSAVGGEGKHYPRIPRCRRALRPLRAVFCQGEYMSCVPLSGGCVTAWTEAGP